MEKAPLNEVTRQGEQSILDTGVLIVGDIFCSIYSLHSYGALSRKRLRHATEHSARAQSYLMKEGVHTVPGVVEELHRGQEHLARMDRALEETFDHSPHAKNYHHRRTRRAWKEYLRAKDRTYRTAKAVRIHLYGRHQELRDAVEEMGSLAIPEKPRERLRTDSEIIATALERASHGRIVHIATCDKDLERIVNQLMATPKAVPAAYHGFLPAIQLHRYKESHAVRAA